MITNLRKRLASWLSDTDSDSSKDAVALLERIAFLEERNRELSRKLVNLASNASYYRKQYRKLKNGAGQNDAAGS